MTAPHADPAALTADLRHVFEGQKTLADRALAQVDDASFFAAQPGEVDPLAVTVKHVGGNLRSRWRDFLTSDGEKPDRHRDGEFELNRDDDRGALMALWESGWSELFGTLDALRPEDWSATVTIRGEPHTVSLAALRSLAHTSYHVGQIVQLSKRALGESWQTLSIPRGGSEAFRRDPEPYRGAKDDGV
jgi:hypothetical protein